MNPSALQILKAFAEGIALDPLRKNVDRDAARAALEAAAKAPGLADDATLVTVVQGVISDARNGIGKYKNRITADVVLRAIDAYQRGIK